MSADIEKSYFTPAGPAEASFTEKNSRFIGRIWPAETETNILEHLTLIREQCREATHNAYAWILRSGQQKCSDDGEPKGTAGLPILNFLKSEDITDICCVVTRYYGGIQLGTGGLARAYAKAAKLALKDAGTNIMQSCKSIFLQCEYSFFERLKSVLSVHGGQLQTSEFSHKVTLEILLPEVNTASFTSDIQALGSGNIEIIIRDTVFHGTRLK